jgi:alkaline phosphatase
MRRLLVMVTLTAACVMGVSATTSAYPIGPTLALSATTVAPGAPFSATFDGCILGETVSVSIEGGDSDSATCAGPAGSSRWISQEPGGTATVTLTAPTVPGTYTVTGTTSESGLSATATLTVAAAAPAPGAPAPGQLPTTGSDSSVPIAQIAAGVLIAGVGLAGVAMYRRRPART